jgi:hypothetical protein
MDVNDLAARVKRLDALARGLAKETAVVQADTLTLLLTWRLAPVGMADWHWAGR